MDDKIATRILTKI